MNPQPFPPELTDDASATGANDAAQAPPDAGASVDATKGSDADADAPTETGPDGSDAGDSTTSDVVVEGG